MTWHNIFCGLATFSEKLIQKKVSHSAWLNADFENEVSEEDSLVQAEKTKSVKIFPVQSGGGGGKGFFSQWVVASNFPKADFVRQNLDTFKELLHGVWGEMVSETWTTWGVMVDQLFVVIYP